MSTPIPQQCHPVHPKLAFHQLSPCHMLQQPPELEPAAGRREGLPHLIYCRFVCCQSRVQLGGAWSRWGWEVQLSSAFDPTERRIPRAVAEDQDILPLPFLLCKWKITGVTGKASGHRGWGSRGKFHPDTSQSWGMTASVVTAAHHTSLSEVMH